jgi:hypothetical protein
MAGKILIFLGLFALAAGLAADEVQLRADHPDTYTVQKGDTLWDIAGRFLTQPWQWPEIWESNPQIENPHLIYPGDVVALQFKDGKPTLSVAAGGVPPESTSDAPAGGVGADRRDVKLSPTIRETQHVKRIQHIPLDAIQQFLSRPRIVTDDEIGRAGYVVGSLEEGLVFGRGHRVYVRGLGEPSTNKFSIFRKGPVYRDPDTDAVLGYEAQHVGDGLVERFGDPATIHVVTSNKEVLKGDRLMPEMRDEIPEFIPHTPNADIEGKIISVIDGVSQIGQHQVVVLNRGNSDGLEPGHVLAIYQEGRVIKDPIASDIADREKLRPMNGAEEGRSFLDSVVDDARTVDRTLRDFLGTPVTSTSNIKVRLPEERAGELMVFRTFDSVSYALVMNFQRPIHILDNVRNP